MVVGVEVGGILQLGKYMGAVSHDSFVYIYQRVMVMYYDFRPWQVPSCGVP